MNQPWKISLSPELAGTAADETVKDNYDNTGQEGMPELRSDDVLSGSNGLTVADFERARKEIEVCRKQELKNTNRVRRKIAVVVTATAHVAAALAGIAVATHASPAMADDGGSNHGDISGGPRTMFLAKDVNNNIGDTRGVVEDPSIRSGASDPEALFIVQMPDGKYDAAKTGATPDGRTVIDATTYGAGEIPVMDGKGNFFIAASQTAPNGLTMIRTDTTNSPRTVNNPQQCVTTTDTLERSHRVPGTSVGTIPDQNMLGPKTTEAFPQGEIFNSTNEIQIEFKAHIDASSAPRTVLYLNQATGEYEPHDMEYKVLFEFTLSGYGSVEVDLCKQDDMHSASTFITVPAGNGSGTGCRIVPVGYDRTAGTRTEFTAFEQWGGASWTPGGGITAGEIPDWVSLNPDGSPRLSENGSFIIDPERAAAALKGAQTERIEEHTYTLTEDDELPGSSSHVTWSAQQ